MPDWNAIQAFMAAVVPWPASPQDAGYVNLHYSSMDRKDPTKLYRGGGWPFRSVETIIKRAAWINTTTAFKDVWYCLSLQSTVKPNPRAPEKPRAERKTANALALKAIWIDADVGTKAGEYATVEKALEALITFRERHGLPQFSALVGSGGGVHAYWISKDPLAVKDWSPYAEGLRALLIQDKLVKDPGLTADAARILRIPGTFNHKTTPPKPVQLFNTPLVMYDFPTQLALLPTLAPQMSSTVQVNKSEPHPLFADGVDPAIFKVPPILAPIPGETLGSVVHEAPLLSIEPIFKNCGFYQEALVTNGRDYDQALWMYSILGTTFMENGNAIAHEISRGHPSYSALDTQAMYDRKVADRADRGIGYPSCAAIAGAGCQSCQTCPLFAKGKSPLNIRPAVTAAVNGMNMSLPQNQSQGAKDLHLPLGYDVDDKGRICQVEEVMVNGEVMPPKLHQLFWSILSDPWAQTGPDALNFTTSTDMGNTRPASIRQEDMGGMALQGVWGRQGIKIFPNNKSRLEHFIVSWLAKLHEIRAAQQSLPFGWHRIGDNFRGFVFDGKLMLDDGTETPCGIGDPELRDVYKATGDVKHWFTACNTITAMKRPQLDAIIAMSFAAPLQALIGKNAVTLSAYGDSGARKSAAYSVGISVWGHAIKAKQTSESTFNGVIRTMGELSNLPLYWDEIKEGEPQKVVYKYLFTAGDGVEKARMKDGQNLQKRGTWQTMMCIASNLSFGDYILTRDRGHTAGLSRVFEYFVKKIDIGPGLISETSADMIIDKLKSSYGHIGLRYGKLLAMNHKAIQKECADTCRQVEVDLKNSGEERFWVALVGTLLVGARLANELGATLDLPALKTFLYDTYLENRKKRDEMITLAGSRSTISENMNRFLAKAETNDQMLYTKGMPNGPGAPASITIVHQPKDLRNTQVQMAVSVRWDISGKQLFISKDEFKAFLEENQLPVGTTFHALKTEFGMEVRTQTRLGAGVFTSARLTCLWFNLADPDHDWAEMLYRFSPNDRPPPTEKPGRAEPGVQERIDPGFTPTGLTPTEDVVAFVKAAVRG